MQLIPVVAREAEQLTVFQRSPAFTLPWQIRAFEPGELDALKADYPQIRAAQREHPVGAARLSAFSVLLDMLVRPPVKSATPEDKQRAVEEHGVMGALNWGDIFFDIDANRMATELYGQALARIVSDPQTAASLTPSHPFACKRPIIDQGYYETFNRDNVTLVDLRKGAIRAVTETGISTEQGDFDLDVIVYATGFDAMTGALSRIDVRGRGGLVLGSTGPRRAHCPTWGWRWRLPEPVHHPGAGESLGGINFVAALEQHVEWIADCIAYLRAGGTAVSRRRRRRRTNGSSTPPRW